MACDGTRGDDDSTVTSDGEPSGIVSRGSTIDTVFELLSNRRRRFALYTLFDSADSVVDMDDLVESVTTFEARNRTGSPEPEHGKHVANDLETWHLEVLAESGVVEYDDRSGIVRFHGDPDLERWLDRAMREELDADNRV